MPVLNQQVFRHKHDKIYEQLAKPGRDYSVYSNKHYQGEIILEYRVEKVFQDKASGFYALGLVSISGDNPPVLVVRGFGTWGSLEEFPTEFLPYKDIPDVFMAKSDEHFQAAKKSGVIEWLQEKAVIGIKPDVVGQSLGGKVGQQLTVEVPDYIHSLVAFNPIGISAKEFDKYQGKVEIFHYINPVDFVSYVLGEKFLPGTILQVYNPDIKSADLLGQHNKLVLDSPKTLIKQVEIEEFYWVREVYQSLRNYSKTVQTNFEGLSKIVKTEAKSYGINMNNSDKNIWKTFDSSHQSIHQSFNQIMQAIRQESLKYPDRQRSAQLLQQKINYSVEAIQNEVESLTETVQKEIEDAGETFKSFRQTLQQELKDLVGIIRQKLDNLLQEETRLHTQGKQEQT